LQDTGLPVLALAFAATLALRVLQGPTTVALMATAGILQPLVATMDLSPNRLALLALAMGAGGMCLSHVNDGGFWFVTRLSGLTTREGLTRWTPATAAGGGIAFLLIALLWQVVP
jgi:GntP family gluconate:H+ symporter